MQMKHLPCDKRRAVQTGNIPTSVGEAMSWDGRLMDALAYHLTYRAIKLGESTHVAA